MDANARADRKKAKVQPIADGDPMEKGLPTNVDAERMVLGSILLQESHYPEVRSRLVADDFSLEKHRRIFIKMGDLHGRSEHIDRVTVANELMKHNELEACGGLSYLVSMDDGLPQVPHLDSYVRIVQEKSTLRSMIFTAQKALNECLLQTTAPAQILTVLQADIEVLNKCAWLSQGDISRVEDLESIFTDQSPMEYLIYPELPAKALVTLAGDSESGKTTLACAWARDAMLQGHAVLLLDRDRNPRERVRDRMKRLGIPPGFELFSVWDCEQKSEPPQPNDPRVVAWVKRMVEQTGKSPLVILDSLISFFLPDEDENAAVDMRALFDRCRLLTGVGGTVVPLHHTNRNGEARGSSDFKPASDQAFLVSNHDRGGGRLLDVITLKYEKSRYGHSGQIVYHYAGGEMMRAASGASGKQPQTPAAEQLQALLIDSPGILSDPFVKLAQKLGVTREIAREFLKEGQSTGAIRVEEKGRGRRHFWCQERTDVGDPDAY